MTVQPGDRPDVCAAGVVAGRLVVDDRLGLAGPAVILVDPARRELGSQPLDVRAFAAEATDTVGRLERASPEPGAHGLINAVTAIDVALAALRIAARQAATGPDTPDRPAVPPLDLAVAVERAAQFADAFGQVAERLTGQAGRLYIDALRDRVTGPPGSTPTAEVERGLRSLTQAREAADDAGIHLRRAVPYLARLTPKRDR